MRAVVNQQAIGYAYDYLYIHARKILLNCEHEGHLGPPILANIIIFPLT